jgi:hypothetical protein
MQGKNADWRKIKGTIYNTTLFFQGVGNGSRDVRSDLLADGLRSGRVESLMVGADGTFVAACSGLRFGQRFDYVRWRTPLLMSAFRVSGGHRWVLQPVLIASVVGAFRAFVALWAFLPFMDGRKNGVRCVVTVFADSHSGGILSQAAGESEAKQTTP